MTTCQRCGVPVWWGTNERTGNKMILDDRSYSDGNVVVCGQDGDGGPMVRVLTKAEMDAATPMLPGLEPMAAVEALDDVPRWKVHQATCGVGARA